MRNPESDGIRGETRLGSTPGRHPEGGNAYSVDEQEADHALSRDMVDVAAEPPDVVRVSYGDGGQAVFLRFVESDVDGTCHGHLAESPVTVEGCGHRIFLDGLDFGVGDDVVLLDGVEVLRDANQSVGVVTGTVGFSEQGRDEFCVVGRGPRPGKDSGDGVDEFVRGETWHVEPRVRCSVKPSSAKDSRDDLGVAETGCAEPGVFLPMLPGPALVAANVVLVLKFGRDSAFGEHL